MRSDNALALYNMMKTRSHLKEFSGQSLSIGKTVNRTISYLKIEGDSRQTGTPSPSNPNLFISIHCNSSADSSANGTETLIYAHGGQAEKLAGHVQSNLISILGTLNRGVKTQNVCVLRESSMPAILVETAFISNSSNAKLLVNKQHEIAQGIARGLFEFLGMELKEMIQNAEQAIDKINSKGANLDKEFWLAACNHVNFLKECFIKIANVM